MQSICFDFFALITSGCFSSSGLSIPFSIPHTSAAFKEALAEARTAEDKQKNRGKIFIAKNRNGPDGIVYNIHMDTSNVDIKIVPTAATPQIQINPVALGPEMQQQVLQKRYEKFRNKGRN